MNKKLFATMLSFILVFSIVLAACGNSNVANTEEKANNSNPSTTQSAVEEPSATKEDVKLRFSWWGGDARHEATINALDKYMELNPHVTIESEYGGFDGYEQKLKTQLAGKTAPDLIQVDQPWLYDLATQSDMFLDLNTMTDIVDLSTFDQKFLTDYTVVNDQLQGLPTGSNGMIMTYNKTFFEKYGIPENTQFDWDNLLEIGTKVHDESQGKDVLLNVDPSQLSLMFKSFVRQKTGNQFIEEDFTLGFGNAEAQEALEYIEKYFENGVVQTLAESAAFHNKIESHPKWFEGGFGMIMNYPSTIPALKTGVDFEVDVMAIIIGKDAKTTAIVSRPSQVFAIAKGSKHPEETAKLLNWLLNDQEGVLILGDVRGTPASSSALAVLEEAGKLDPIIKKGTEIAFATSGGPQNGITTNAELEKIIADIIEKLAYKRSTPVESAADMITSLNAKLKEIKGSN